MTGALNKQLVTIKNKKTAIINEVSRTRSSFSNSKEIREEQQLKCEVVSFNIAIVFDCIVATSFSADESHFEFENDEPAIETSF